MALKTIEVERIDNTFHFESCEIEGAGTTT
jgi:hypothetical protein